MKQGYQKRSKKESKQTSNKTREDFSQQRIPRYGCYRPNDDVSTTTSAMITMAILITDSYNN